MWTSQISGYLGKDRLHSVEKKKNKHKTKQKNCFYDMVYALKGIYHIKVYALMLQAPLTGQNPNKMEKKKSIEIL